LIASRADSFGVSVHAGVVGFPPGFASATANFADDYVFTVSGGSGNGFFFPLFVLDHNGGTAGISFAGIGGPPCLPDIVSCSKPFTFGVPQIVAISGAGQAFGVSTRVGDAAARLDQILFFDPSGNELSNVAFTLVSADLPEPSALSLLSIGLIFLAVRIRGVRFRDTSTDAICDDAIASAAADQRLHAVIIFTNNSLEFAGDRWHNKGSTNSKSYAAVSHQHAARRDPSFSIVR